MTSTSPRFNRRTFLRGAGVTMALPWLESIPRLGRRAADARCGAGLPEAVRRAVHGLRHQPEPLVGQGLGRDDGAEPVPRAAGAAQGQARTSSPACSTSTPRASASIPGQTGNILSGAALQKGAELKGGISIDQVLASHLGEETRAAEHGPGLRAADHRLPRDELLDGLQLAHLLAERDLAGADGGLSVAGLRQPLRQPGQPANAEHPRPRARSRPRT